MIVVNTLVHLKSLVNSIIMFDKEKNTRTNVGFDCEHNSPYFLNEETRIWFESKIFSSLNIISPIPDVQTEEPKGMDNTLITTLNFQNYLIFLVMDNTDVKHKENLHQISVIELMALMHTSLSRDLDINDLKRFIDFKDAYDCVGCNTKKICFPRHSYDVLIM